MSEVRLVVAILVPAIFTLILKDFFDLFMTNRYEGKVKQYTIWMLYFLLDTAISMNFKFVGVISMLYSFIILIIFCAVLYREDIKYITLTVLFIICIGAASELIVALGIRAFLNSSQLQQFSLFGSTCSKLIILIIVRIVKLFRVSGIKRLDYMNWLANVSMTAGSLCDMPSKYCFMLTVLPVISTVVVYNIFLITSRIDRLELIAFSTVSSTLILALNLLVYDIYIKLLEQTEIRRENAIYEKQISLFQEQIYVKETAMLNDKMVRDKFYHQLSFIKELVYQRELSQLNEFIDGIMQNKKIEKDGPANSGNVLLDYIVNNKCEIAVKQGIECTVKIEVPYKFPFSDGDIFIILGNALDNAIEGALKCVSRRYIHIKIIYRKENLFIKISNSFDGKVKKDRHGHLISMKSDLTRYGLGLALIEKSVNKYNGLLNFDIDEENFTLTVLLYS